MIEEFDSSDVHWSAEERRIITTLNKKIAGLQFGLLAVAAALPDPDKLFEQTEKMRGFARDGLRESESRISQAILETLDLIDQHVKETHAHTKEDGDERP